MLAILPHQMLELMRKAPDDPRVEAQLRRERVWRTLAQRIEEHPVQEHLRDLQRQKDQEQREGQGEAAGLPHAPAKPTAAGRKDFKNRELMKPAGPRDLHLLKQLKQEAEEARVAALPPPKEAPRALPWSMFGEVAPRPENPAGGLEAAQQQHKLLEDGASKINKSEWPQKRQQQPDAAVAASPTKQHKPQHDQAQQQQQQAGHGHQRQEQYDGHAHGIQPVHAGQHWGVTYEGNPSGPTMAEQVDQAQAALKPRRPAGVAGRQRRRMAAFKAPAPPTAAHMVHAVPQELVD